MWFYGSCVWEFFLGVVGVVEYVNKLFVVIFIMFLEVKFIKIVNDFNKDKIIGKFIELK